MRDPVELAEQLIDCESVTPATGAVFESNARAAGVTLRWTVGESVPAAILADEPTSAVDDDNCAAAMQLLLQCAGTENATLVVATHDARIRSHFDQVIELPGNRP